MKLFKVMHYYAFVVIAVSSSSVHINGGIHPSLMNISLSVMHARTHTHTHTHICARAQWMWVNIIFVKYNIYIIGMLAYYKNCFMQLHIVMCVMCFGVVDVVRAFFFFFFFLIAVDVPRRSQIFSFLCVSFFFFFFFFFWWGGGGVVLFCGLFPFI